MDQISKQSPLATEPQRNAETLALRLIEHPQIRAARESARAILLMDPVARGLDGRTGLDRALDQWVLALTMRIVNADPDRPAVVWNVYNPPRHWFGHVFQGAAVAIDNPDNSNREISVDGAASYQIHGRLGTPATQLTIEIVTDFEGYNGLGRTICALTTQQIVADAEGRFTITVDAEPAGERPNHLQSAPGLCWIFSRDSMSDWGQIPTTLSVARIAGPPAKPPRNEAEIIADIVASMPSWVKFWCGFKDDFLGYPAPGKLVGPNGRPGGWGFLAGGRFEIADDDAVVVITTSGNANYTGFQISDPWTLSPDPVARLASLNKSQAAANADGRFVYVLAARDPGVHNWIDTVGLHEGWMMLRWQGVPPATDPASLICSIETVKLSNLAAALPPGTPMATLSSRSAQIAERIEKYSRRYIE